MLHKFDLIAFREKTISIFKKYGIDINQTTDCWNLEIGNKEKFKFSLEIPSKGIRLARSFYKKENYIEYHHDLFKLPTNFQGKGLSKEIFRELYIHYQQMGVKNIIVTANIDIGGYTWARYGFRAINQQEALNAIALTEETGEI